MLKRHLAGFAITLALAGCGADPQTTITGTAGGDPSVGTTSAADPATDPTVPVAEPSVVAPTTPGADSGVPADPGGAAGPGPVNPPGQAPVLPDAALDEGPDGAAAFVRHWWDLASYAERSGDAAPLVAASSPDCAVCRRIAADSTSRGGRVTGHLWTVTSVSMNAADGTATGQVSVQQAAGTRSDGTALPAGNAGYPVTLVYGSDGWRMESLS